MAAKPFIFLIDIYRYLISPMLPQSCRFYPSCSGYSRDALLKYGLVKGLYLSLKRLLKCQPFHPGGYVPLPHIKIKKQDY
jgi:hypothetical protein